jgi:hypothetical protein
MRLHRLTFLFAAALLALTFAQPARANVMIIIDKSAQKMTVTVDGEDRYTWPVSTGRPGYDTPSGEFQPFRMERNHFSREWDDAPMPNSVFFSQIGHAIHGTFDARNLGRPASHGCVRLSTQNAATLFALVKDEGVFNTRVRLIGETPQSDVPVARRDNDRDTVRNNDRDAVRNRDYARNYTTDDNDTVATPPQRSRQPRSWADIQLNPRSYYYRERPYYRSYGGRGLFGPYGW